jgi:hypothetical protein
MALAAVGYAKVLTVLDAHRMVQYRRELAVELTTMAAQTETRVSARGEEIPLAVCHGCHHQIEFYSRVWWRSGTCGTYCSDLDAEHAPAPYEPAPIHDPEALDRWLRSG